MKTKGKSGVRHRLKSVTVKTVVMRNSKVDDLLKQLSVLHSNMGSDSTEKDKEELKTKENEIRDKIAELDKQLAERLFP